MTSALLGLPLVLVIPTACTFKLSKRVVRIGSVSFATVLGFSIYVHGFHIILAYINMGTKCEPNNFRCPEGHFTANVPKIYLSTGVCTFSYHVILLFGKIKRVPETDLQVFHCNRLENTFDRVYDRIRVMRESYHKTGFLTEGTVHVLRVCRLQSRLPRSLSETEFF